MQSLASVVIPAKAGNGVSWGSLLRLCLLLLGLALAAHPVPFSYLNLHVEKDRIDGTLYDACP